jgi:hypothetical protein
VFNADLNPAIKDEIDNWLTKWEILYYLNDCLGQNIDRCVMDEMGQ